MTDWLNLAMLVAASIGALVFGVLAAYGALRVSFWLMRPQSQRVSGPMRRVAARLS